MKSTSQERLLDAGGVSATLDRLTREIHDSLPRGIPVAVIGIRSRGEVLAGRMVAALRRMGAPDIEHGTLDITLYRDDLMAVGPRPVVGETELPPDGIDDRTVVVVDDVLFTGRTVRAALNELMDWGRPARVLLCVLVDRGGRELPIQPDVVGRRVEILQGQTVEVLVPGIDGRLGVDVVTPGESR